MNGFTWLNDLMTWLSKWVPRLVLVKATHQGVKFSPKGRVLRLLPGLHCYWPIISDVELISMRPRTLELAAQLHGSEAIAIVLWFHVSDSVLAATHQHDVLANLDDRTQAALARAYRPGITNDDLRATILPALQDEWRESGVAITSVDVAQRGPVWSLRMLSDWGTHEARGL